MIPKTFKEVIDLGDGRTITLETGKLAKQAHGSVVVQMGNAMLLCTVVSSHTPTTMDFFPLTLDYREKFAANLKRDLPRIPFVKEGTMHRAPCILEGEGKIETPSPGRPNDEAVVSLGAKTLLCRSAALVPPLPDTERYPDA